jgi:hypothetical protein
MVEALACSGAGTALALGAFLDGVPEQLVLGLGIALGDGVSVGLLGAIFVSNLPEAVGSASAMRQAGWPTARTMGSGARWRPSARLRASRGSGWPTPSQARPWGS